MKRIKKINKKVMIIGMIVIIILITLTSMKKINTNIINKDKQAEIIEEFSWEAKAFNINDDYTYTYEVLIIIQETEGIDTVAYTKDGEEIVINANRKQKLAIDYQALENTDYEFKITPYGGQEKTEILHVERRVSGKDTYKLVNGIYVNTPYLENFNSKNTRYLSITNNDTLKIGNWINNQEPENWYDYANQKWANIYVEAEGAEGYYVWIPKYMYKLNEETQRTDVKFVDVYNNYIDATTKEVTTYGELIEQGYKLPEAFEYGDGNNLLDSNIMLTTSISGYWISKYQLNSLKEFNINYEATANNNNIVINNFTNNVTDKALKYTYSINGEIVNTVNTLGNYTFGNLNSGENYTINITALGQNDTVVGSMTKVISTNNE